MALNSPPIISSLLGSLEQDPHSCRAMVFTIANHRFALPLQAIARVICDPTGLNGLHPSPSFMLYRDRPLSLLNLYPLLEASPCLDGPDLPQTPLPGAIAIIVQPADEGLWAIPVDGPPRLMLLSLAQVYPLPASLPPIHHHLADYMVILDQEAVPTSLLLMNLQKAIRCRGEL